ncbi:hypothetical protein SMICM304S_04363 [Streptomyces microflavus]
MAELLQGGAVVEFLDRFDADPARSRFATPSKTWTTRADDPQVDEGGGGQGLRHPLGYGKGEVLGASSPSTI